MCAACMMCKAPSPMSPASNTSKTRMSTLRWSSGCEPSGFRPPRRPSESDEKTERTSLLSTTIRPANPLRATVSSATVHMCCDISTPTTVSAPARAAIMPSNPEPVPASSTVTCAGARVSESPDLAQCPRACTWEEVTLRRATARVIAFLYASFLAWSLSMSKCHAGTMACLGLGGDVSP